MRTLTTPNPLAPRGDFVAVVEPGDRLTPHLIISGQGLRFPGPVLCMVGTGFWLRRDWDAPLPVGVVVRFVVAPQGGIGRILGVIAVLGLSVVAPYALGITGTMAGALLSTAIAVGGSLLLGMLFPSTAGSTADVGTADTAYSLSNVNRYRPGEPFAERFGRRPFYPDVAMSFVRYEDNEQYLYVLLVLGIGWFDDVDATIDKTPLSNYAGAASAVIQPGARPAICTNVVWTSGEVSGQELDTDWISYVVNPRGTNAYWLEYDIAFPSGLVGYNDEGNPYSVCVTMEARARSVDAYGNATGDWVALPAPSSGASSAATGVLYMGMAPSTAGTTFTASGSGYWGKSKDPLRTTFVVAAPSGPGRYEFAIRRTAEASGSGKVVDRVVLAGLRGVGGLHPAVDGVTMWEAKVKATDQLNGDAGSKIQVEATRMLYPVTATGYGTARAATRSIVDACAYMVTGDNGGRQSTANVAWDVLAELRAEFAAAGCFFDYGFTSRVSVMDACTTAAACGGAVAYTPGGLFCLAANTMQTAYGVPFTDDDFDPGSFKITTTHRTPDSCTCVRVTYYDPDSGQDETVDCYETGGSILNPKEVDLIGCTSRQVAYKLGMLLYRDMMQSTVNVEFTTGLKGNLPALFSWVPVGSTVPDWNQTGVLAAVDGGTVWTSEPLDFGGEAEGWLTLAMPDGTNGGPYSVVPTDYAHAVTMTAPAAALTIQGNDARATRYIFGPASRSNRLVRIMAIAPQGRDKVTISGQVVSDAIYADVGTAPGYDQSPVAGAALMSMALFYLGSSGGTHEYRAVWTGTAAEFRIDTSSDGAGYVVAQDDYVGYSVSLSTTATAFAVQVTPYVNETLDATQTLSAGYTVAASVSGLAVTVDGDSVDVSWTAAAGAASYRVAIYVDGERKALREVTAVSTSFTASDLSTLGGPWPEFTTGVAAVVGGTLGAEASVSSAVSPLAAPTGLTLQAVLASGVTLSWNPVAGATGYKVYVGDGADFDPAGEGTLVYAGGSTAATVGGLTMTTPYAYYFRAAATDTYHTAAADLTFSVALPVTG